MVDIGSASPSVFRGALGWIQVTSAAIDRDLDVVGDCISAKYFTILRVSAVVAGFAIVSNTTVFEISRRPITTRIGMTLVTILGGRYMAFDRCLVIRLAQDRIVRGLELTVVTAFATIRFG